MESNEVSRVKVYKSSADRISSLPDSLVDSILACLTDDLGIVVRTSVLSKRWRYCWTRVRKLCFHSNFLRQYVKPKRLEFMIRIVESVLARHDGFLDYFSMYSVNTNGEECEPLDVCKWMDLFSTKRIRELSFFVTPSYVGNPCSQILMCDTLMDLSLHWCDFGLSSEFIGFTKLVSIRLEGVVMNWRLLETVIANSPLLKNLDLTEMCSDDSYSAVIDAPGLENLCLITVGEFCLKEYPRLVSACLGSDFDVPMAGYGRSKMDNFAHIMPRVESLSFDDAGLTALAADDIIPVKLVRTLENLKLLDFDEFDILSLDQLACFFCLIRSAPNLQKLQISVYDFSDVHHDGTVIPISFYEEQKKLGKFNRLSTLRVDNMLGRDWEVNFISTLVACCPTLETALFSCNEDIDLDSEDWLFDELDKLQLPETADMKFYSQYEED